MRSAWNGHSNGPAMPVCSATTPEAGLWGQTAERTQPVMTEYLITFFRTLRALSPGRPEWVSDAIAYNCEDGMLYALIGMGDVRVRVPMQEFSSNPAEAAEVAINRLRAMSSDERDSAMEEVRS